MKLDVKEFEGKMQKTLTAYEKELESIRLGRANPVVLNKITVDYYGCPTPINQMASVSVPEPRLLQIQPYDASTLKDIEKAINEKAGANVVANMTILAEGDAADRKDIIYLEKLPLFKNDGTILE